MDPKKLEVKFVKVALKFLEYEKWPDTYKNETVDETSSEVLRARNILIEMDVGLNEVIKCAMQINSTLIMNIINEKAIRVLVLVYFHMGTLNVRTGHLKSGEKHLMMCKDILIGKKLETCNILLFMNTLNHLGSLLFEMKEPTKAREILELAEQTYKEFKNTKMPCYDLIEMIKNYGINESAQLADAKDQLEAEYKLAIYNLAQVYGILKLHCKSAMYLHLTLPQDGNLDKVPDFKYSVWISKVAHTSKCFMVENDFPLARYYLAAASCVLQKYNNLLTAKYKNPDDKLALSEWNVYKAVKADVTTCWAKCGLSLLSFQSEQVKQNDLSVLKDDKSPDNDLDNLKFKNLEDIRLYSDQITDKHLCGFDDARSVFANILKWLEEAKQYYVSEGAILKVVDNADDMAKAYKFLTCFEENKDRQAKMHKRRVHIYEDVLKSINLQDQKAACGSIWLHLGDAYSDILSIKFDRLGSTNEEPTPQAAMKIDKLRKNARVNYQAYLDSIGSHLTYDENTEMSADTMRNALYCYVKITHLYGSMITTDCIELLRNTQNSTQAYQYVQNYCNKHPETLENVPPNFREFLKDCR